MKIVLIFLLACFLNNEIYSKPLTIPAIRYWEDSEGEYEFKDHSRILIKNSFNELQIVAETLSQDIADLHSVKVAVVESDMAQNGDIILEIVNDPTIGEEGYKLKIDNNIRVSGNSSKGVFYGTRTILQLLDQNKKIKSGKAIDYPTYKERGLMVDNGRKFFTRDWLETHIKELAYFKLNIFHWHFSEDLGFRIESEKFPEVVSKDHLSKVDVKYLLDVAKRYHVTIIPEIDMPGHMRALLRGRADSLGLKYNHGFLIESFLDISNDNARAFAKEVIEEYLELFPGPYWHMGSDEYIYDNFHEFPQLEGYVDNKYGKEAIPSDIIFDFINWVNAIVRSHGKTLRIWNDSYSFVMSDKNVVKLDTNIIIEYWGADDQPQKLIDKGFDILNCSIDFLYYNIGQSFLGYYHYLYEIWHPGLYQANKPVDPINPKNRGAKFHVWCDHPTLEEEWHIAKGIRFSTRILSQKLWGSNLIVKKMEEFKQLTDFIGVAPNTGFPENPMPGNLVFGKVAYSSSENPNYTNSTQNITDAYYHTKWSSGFNDQEWIYVDLLDTFEIDRVKLVWYRQLPKEYHVQASLNETNWETIYTQDSIFHKMLDLDSIKFDARYIRVLCDDVQDSTYFALYEMEAYGKEKVFDDTGVYEGKNILMHSFPNPSSGVLHIDFERQIFNGKIKIYTQNGNKIDEIIINGQKSITYKNEFKLPQMLFFLLFENEQLLDTEKILLKE